jgi:hypothetical protein
MDDVGVHGDRTRPLQEAGMTKDSSFSRKLAARAPLIASVVGMLISLSSVFYFVEDDFRRILGVTAGLFCLLLAVYYATHPFVKNERHYPELRGEVVKFVDLARELHHAAVRGDDGAFDEIKDRVPAQVETVIDTARKSEESGPTVGD